MCDKATRGFTINIDSDPELRAMDFLSQVMDDLITNHTNMGIDGDVEDSFNRITKWFADKYHRD
jgi:hypothetical protein